MGGPWLSHLGHGESQRLVVDKSGEVPTFQQGTKVSDSEVETKQLPVESAVLTLAGAQLTAEEGGKWLPGPANPLLVDGTDSLVRGVRGDGDGGCGRRTCQHGGVRQGRLSGNKSLVPALSPVHSVLGLTLQGLMQGLHELGGSRDETVVKIHHAEELLQGLDSERAWELRDRLHL